MSDSRDYLGEYARTVQERIRQVDTVLRTNDRLVEQSKAVIDRSWDLLRTAPQMDTPSGRRRLRPERDALGLRPESDRDGH